MRAPLLIAALVVVAGCSLLDAAGGVDDGQVGGDCTGEDCFGVVDSGTEVDTPEIIAVGGERR